MLWLLNCPEITPNFLWRTAMHSQPDSLLNPSKAWAKHRHPPQYLSLPGPQSSFPLQGLETRRSHSANLSQGVSPFIPSCLTPQRAGLAYYTSTDLFSDFSVELVSCTVSLQGQGSATVGSKSSRRSLWWGTGRTKLCEHLLDLAAGEEEREGIREKGCVDHRAFPLPGSSSNPWSRASLRPVSPNLSRQKGCLILWRTNSQIILSIVTTK